MGAADDAEFTAFVAASSRRLLRGAYLIAGDLADAEELLQTALERPYRRWPTIRRTAAPEAYVRRLLADRQCADFEVQSSVDFGMQSNVALQYKVST